MRVTTTVAGASASSKPVNAPSTNHVLPDQIKADSHAKMAQQMNGKA